MYKKLISSAMKLAQKLNLFTSFNVFRRYYNKQIHLLIRDYCHSQDTFIQNEKRK